MSYDGEIVSPRISQSSNEEDSVHKIREKQRRELNARRKQQVFEKLSVKRQWGLQNKSIFHPTTKEQMLSLSSELKRHKSKASLEQLNQALADGSQEMIDVFLSTDGALFALVGCLMSKGEDVQSEAAACVINLAVGEHSSTMRIIKTAAPYLIAYLSSGNTELKELSAWALGNMTADCSKCCQVLQAQGLPPALCRLLESPHESVVASACFALACYTLTADDDGCLQVATPATLAFLSQDLQASEQGTLADVANIIFHLSCRNSLDGNLLQAGLVTQIMSKLAAVVDAETDNLKILTPLSRALGNLASSDCLTCLLAHPHLTHIVQRLLMSRYNHIKKEALWLVANMAAGGEEGAAFVSQACILQQIIQMVDAMGEIGTQALTCLCNLSTVRASCLAISCHQPYFPVERILGRPDLPGIILSMTFLLHVLRNNGVHMEMAGCGQALHTLQYHNAQQIRKMATHLIDMISTTDITDEIEQE